MIDKVEQVTSVDHLGHTLSTVIKHSMVNSAHSQVWRSFNLFIVNLAHSNALNSELRTQKFIY